MKIAHLIAQFYPYVGGAEVCVHNICDSLARSGHEAVVVTTTPPPENPPQLPYEVVYLSPRTCGLLRKLPWLGKLYLRYELGRLQKARKFDLWQVTMGYPLGTYAADFFASQKVPAVLRCCGQDIQTLPELDYGYRLDSKIDELVRKTYPRYAGFVANSPTMKDEYLALGIPASSVEIIPNGVQLSLFAETSPDIELKNVLTGGRDVPLILTSGRYHEKKGFHLIPEMARTLKGMGFDFVWAIAGRGNKKILELCPNAEALGIRVLEKVGGGGKKSFALPSREMIALYKAADIFAFPSLIEGLPTVCVEALAAGLPVVATDAPGVRDIIRGGENGIAVKPGDAKAFADALAQVLRSPELAASLREKALASVKGNDWPAVAKRYQAFYERIIGGKDA